jgi:hypothetical protein
VPLTGHALDTFIAPRLSELTVVGAPDLRGCTESYGTWVNVFVLNTIFNVMPPARSRQLSLHFLRKTDGAFQEYEDARVALSSYLARPGERVSAYFHALRRFELAAILAYEACDTLSTMITERFFQKKGGTPLQRLNRLHNLAKHANKELERGDVPQDVAVPIWTTDTGIEAHDAKLDWSEFAELLQGLARCAEMVANPLARAESKPA